MYTPARSSAFCCSVRNTPLYGVCVCVCRVCGFHICTNGGARNGEWLPETQVSGVPFCSSRLATSSRVILRSLEITSSLVPSCSLSLALHANFVSHLVPHRRICSSAGSWRQLLRCLPSMQGGFARPLLVLCFMRHPADAGPDPAGLCFGHNSTEGSCSNNETKGVNKKKRQTKKKISKISVTSVFDMSSSPHYMHWHTPLSGAPWSQLEYYHCEITLDIQILMSLSSLAATSKAKCSDVNRMRTHTHTHIPDPLRVALPGFIRHYYTG